MNIVKMKTISRKVNSNIKIIGIMTFIIFVMLIVLPLIFLETNKSIDSIFSLNNSSIINNSAITFPVNGKVKLYLKSENKVTDIDLEEYIMGVVASEVPASFNEEALKAQAVAARTFYMNRRVNPCTEAESKGAEVCDTIHCQVYKNKDQRIISWDSTQAESNWNKIQKAVLDTKGQILTYNGEVLKYPQFFAVSAGKTEDAKDVFSIDVPYLKSEDSKGEEIAPKYKTTVKIPVNEFVDKINKEYLDAHISKDNLMSLIKIESYTEAGSVKEIRVGGSKIKGIKFRELFNLNSANFKLSFDNDFVIINCIGYGHGVGMSQWGANVMAKNGSTYREILNHYYNGVKIQEIEYR